MGPIGSAVAYEEFVDPVAVDVPKIVAHIGFFFLTEIGNQTAQAHVLDVLSCQRHVPVGIQHGVVFCRISS